MNIHLTKTRLVVAIAAIVALVPATALATDVFDDVDDNKFYAAATEWAKDNNITTGSPAGSKTFKPDDPVTRGETVTFLNRYDTNLAPKLLTTTATGFDATASLVFVPIPGMNAGFSAARASRLPSARTH